MDALAAVGAQPRSPFGDLGAMFEVAQRLSFVGIALAFMLFGYLAIAIDRRRERSTSRDYSQVGINQTLWFAISICMIYAVYGTEALLAFILGGFKGGWSEMRGPLATAIAGNVMAISLYILLLPRTNNAER